MALGLVAKAKSDDANAVCGPSTCSTSRGVTLEHEAVDYSTAATLSFIAGAALLGAGVTLVVLAPRASAARVVVAPQVSAREAGVAARWSF
jgi:hypothetical protein